MAISWRLKSYLARKHQIYTVTDLQRRIVKKTGIVISHRNLCKYVNGSPVLIRLATIEILCTALQCGLGEFLIVAPKPATKPGQPKKLSPKNTPHQKIGNQSFPEPENYEEHGER